MQDTYDPFSFLLGEIQTTDAGQRHWNPELREHYLRTLLADEARGDRVGRPAPHRRVRSPSRSGLGTDPRRAHRGHRRRVPPANWVRVGGVAGHHTTVTLEGPHTEALINLMADVALQANPGPWRVVATAVVVPTR